MRDREDGSGCRDGSGVAAQRNQQVDDHYVEEREEVSAKLDRIQKSRSCLEKHGCGGEEGKRANVEGERGGGLW